MKNLSKWLWSAIAALATVVAYGMLFPVLYPVTGTATAALIVIPLVMTGWFVGLPACLLLGILGFPLNAYLFNLVGDASNARDLGAALLSQTAFILIGAGAGWIRALMDRLNRQAAELREERRSLQEEMERRKQAEERLAHEALHDPLTNLANRRMFTNRLDHVLEWKKRHPGDLFAVIYLDFDNFKAVNDRLGHPVGDQLLIEMARRLTGSLRATDMVARMGGDEFAILLEGFKSEAEVLVIVKRLQENLSVPFDVNGARIVTSASIGILMSLLGYERIDDILRDADTAMYNAKVSGKNHYHIFTPDESRAGTPQQMSTSNRAG